MRIILAVATVSAAASGLVGNFGAATAAAQPLSRTFGYTCSSFLIGDQSFTVEIDSDIPHSVAVGAPSRTIAVNAVATVGAGFTQWLARVGVRTLGGTVDARAHVSAPQDDFDVKVPFHMATTSVPASGPFKVTATASATTRTFSHPGNGTVTAGGLTLHLLAKYATGNLALRADAPCTPNAGQSDVVTSFDITKPSSVPSVTPSPSTGSVGSATPRPTPGSMGAAVSQPAVSEGAGPAKDSVIRPGNPRPRVSSPTPVTHSTRPTPRPTEPAIAGKPSTAGLDTRDLILLAVGVLAACAAAFGLGVRLKKHRRTGGDGGHQRYIDPKPDWPTEGVKARRSEVSCHRMDLIAAAPWRRGCEGGATSHGSTGRKATDGQIRLMVRHIPHQAGRHGVDARACGGADLNSRLPGLLQGEDVVAGVTDEKPSTAYVPQV